MRKLRLLPFEHVILQEAQKLQQTGQTDVENIAITFTNLTKFAALYATPLSLAMFVPVDAEGNPLQKPVVKLGNDEMTEEQQQFVEAQSRVIFEGFALVNEGEIQRITNGQITVLTRTKHTGNQWLLPMNLKTVSSLTQFEIYLKTQ